MEIKSVKLVNGGFKGFDVVMLKEEEKEGRSKINKVTERPRHPIHLGLEIPFKDLRFHLLQICGLINDDMDKADIDATLEECDVTSVDIEDTYFKIRGVKSVFSEKSYPLPTPKVSAEDDYKHYDTVMKIIEKIVEETEHYLNGSAKVTDEEIAMRWIGAGREKGLDTDAMEVMTEEEKKAKYIEIIEKVYGGTVLLPEDMEDDSPSPFNDSEAVTIDPLAETVKIPA